MHGTGHGQRKTNGTMSLKKHTQKTYKDAIVPLMILHTKKKIIKHLDIEGQILFQLSHSYLETGHHGYTSDQTFFFPFLLLFALTPGRIFVKQLQNPFCTSLGSLSDKQAAL